MGYKYYYMNGKRRRLTVTSPQPLTAGRSRMKPTTARKRSAIRAMATSALSGQSQRFESLFHEVPKEDVKVVVSDESDVAVIATETMVVEGANKSEVKWLRSKFGLKQIREGIAGKLLLQAPEGGSKGIDMVFQAAQESFERGKVNVAHPNFARVIKKVRRSAVGGASLWNYKNDGNPGVPGADIATYAAWTITRGNPEIKIAVLDEGVDTRHPALQQAVVLEHDFVDGNPNARPDGDDAHGTACAGIIASRDKNYPGVASDSSLVAVRIAKSDHNNDWVFDDFETADAIDWAWSEAGADVLSNSWGGGPPVDVISRAFAKAVAKGRNGKGCVVAIATGNSDNDIQYPATLPNVLSVGASNWFDERKSKKSKDNENWWGSCYGTQLDLLAPGVGITTTDIAGARGYSGDDFFFRYNGTSSATPHVAAAAALILSVRPDLGEAQVRKVINQSADRLAPSGKRNKFVGWGRLNAFHALRLAIRL